MTGDSTEACQHRWTTYKTRVSNDGTTRVRKQKCKLCNERRKVSVPVEFAPPRIYPNAGYSSIPSIVEQNSDSPTLE